MTTLTKIAMGCACLMASTFAGAAGQTSTNYAIPRDAINAGVADMASTNYRLSSSVGDAVATGTITSLGYQLSSGFRAEISASPAVLHLMSVVSRKIHGATPFNLTIASQPISGNVTVEPRAIGNGHTLVFHFDAAVTSVNAAATALNSLLQTAGSATAAAVGGGSGDVLVTLTNVADNTRLTITLSGLNGDVTAAGIASASLGFLVGDVNNSRSVNAADISAVKANVGKTPLDINTYKFDLNANGTITQTDVSTVKARSGLVLAP
jgi:hypothetical protein